MTPVDDAPPPPVVLAPPTLLPCITDAPPAEDDVLREADVDEGVLRVLDDAPVEDRRLRAAGYVPLLEERLPREVEDDEPMILNILCIKV